MSLADLVFTAKKGHIFKFQISLPCFQLRVLLEIIRLKNPLSIFIIFPWRASHVFNLYLNRIIYKHNLIRCKITRLNKIKICKKHYTNIKTDADTVMEFLHICAQVQRTTTNGRCLGEAIFYVHFYPDSFIILIQSTLPFSFSQLYHSHSVNFTVLIQSTLSFSFSQLYHFHSVNFIVLIHSTFFIQSTL